MMKTGTPILTGFGYQNRPTRLSFLRVSVFQSYLAEILFYIQESVH